MSKTTYIITGEVDEIAKLAEDVRQFNKFMSDNPNITEYKWYPLTPQTQVMEMEMSKEVAQAELELLTRDLTSLTIGRLYDGVLQDVIADGATEVVVDTPNTTR